MHANVPTLAWGSMQQEGVDTKGAPSRLCSKLLHLPTHELAAQSQWQRQLNHFLVTFSETVKTIKQNYQTNLLNTQNQTMRIQKVYINVCISMFESVQAQFYFLLPTAFLRLHLFSEMNYMLSDSFTDLKSLLLLLHLLPLSLVAVNQLHQH